MSGCIPRRNNRSNAAKGEAVPLLHPELLDTARAQLDEATARLRHAESGNELLEEEIEHRRDEEALAVRRLAELEKEVQEAEDAAAISEHDRKDHVAHLRGPLAATCARLECNQSVQGTSKHCSKECADLDEEDDAMADVHGGEPLSDYVKCIYFDFDQTMSRCHVFKQLGGWEKPRERNTVPPPFAHTDRGQISKIAALNAQGPRWAFDETSGSIVAVGPSDGETWTMAALGGQTRVEMLGELFEDLKAKGVVLTIVTKSYVGAVKKLLLEEGLLGYIHVVVGNIGDHYGGDSGGTDYDKTRKTSDLEGDAECVLKGAKAEFIRRDLERKGFTAHQAVLVEDDPEEVESVRGMITFPHICRAVLVRKRQGMMTAEMQRLRHLAGCPPMADAAAPSELEAELAELRSRVEEGVVFREEWHESEAVIERLRLDASRASRALAGAEAWEKEAAAAAEGHHKYRLASEAEVQLLRQELAEAQEEAQRRDASYWDDAPFLMASQDVVSGYEAEIARSSEIAAEIQQALAHERRLHEEALQQAREAVALGDDVDTLLSIGDPAGLHGGNDSAVVMASSQTLLSSPASMLLERTPSSPRPQSPVRAALVALDSENERLRQKLCDLKIQVEAATPPASAVCPRHNYQSSFDAAVAGTGARVVDQMKEALHDDVALLRSLHQVKQELDRERRRERRTRGSLERRLTAVTQGPRSPPAGAGAGGRTMSVVHQL